MTSLTPSSAPASELILHHFDISPFAEKIRVVLGVKGAAWRSVAIPRIMPKPNVIALTGGYRRTPILQIGADIYCDTALIAAAIDRAEPQSPLWPKGYEATVHALTRFADTTLFECSSVLFGQPHVVERVFAGREDERKAIMADRMAMRQGSAPRPAAMDALATLRAFLAMLDDQLADGRARLLGSITTLADCAVYHPLWHTMSMPGVAEELAPFQNIGRWMAAMRAVGHGRPTPMSSAEAISVALDASPLPLEGGSDNVAFAPGDRVEVLPFDYAFDPVEGDLVQLNSRAVVVSREDARAGHVHVHLPRQGYQIRRK